MSPESALASSRSRFPGAIDAVADFKSLVGLEEQKAPIYNKNETALFENTTKVRMLVEQMEKKEVVEDET